MTRLPASATNCTSRVWPGSNRTAVPAAMSSRMPRDFLRSNFSAGWHQLGDGAAVACALDDEVGDDGDRLGVVKLDATLQPAARHHGSHRDQELVLFAGREIHASTLVIEDLVEPKPLVKPKSWK